MADRTHTVYPFTQLKLGCLNELVAVAIATRADGSITASGHCSEGRTGMDNQTIAAVSCPLDLHAVTELRSVVASLAPMPSEQD